MNYTKKDFKLEWFSGQGAGGQHRNKHQNCCRITHLATGIRTQSTEFRERSRNQEHAFNRMAKLLLALNESEKERNLAGTEVILNYHEPRNEVHDKASGFKQTYKQVVEKGDISKMIQARLQAKSAEDNT